MQLNIVRFFSYKVYLLHFLVVLLYLFDVIHFFNVEHKRNVFLSNRKIKSIQTAENSIKSFSFIDETAKNIIKSDVFVAVKPIFLF